DRPLAPRGAPWSGPAPGVSLVDARERALHRRAASRGGGRARSRGALGDDRQAALSCPRRARAPRRRRRDEGGGEALREARGRALWTGIRTVRARPARAPPRETRGRRGAPSRVRAEGVEGARGDGPRPRAGNRLGRSRAFASGVTVRRRTCRRTELRA